MVFLQKIMAQPSRKLLALTESIGALRPTEQATLMEMVMTPRMRLRLLVNQVRRQRPLRDERQIDRVVNRTVRRIRSASRPG